MNNEYEDLNKIFVDPKKAQEEAAAAAKKAEEEELAAKAKAAATVVRKAAGQVWEDSSLLEFDESKDTHTCITQWNEESGCSLTTGSVFFSFFIIFLLGNAFVR